MIFLVLLNVLVKCSIETSEKPDLSPVFCLLTLYREIHPLDPQPHRHSMLVPWVCAPRVTRCSLGKYWSRDFFQKEAESSRQGVGNPEISFRCLYLGQIGCQGDGVSRQPGWGTQVIYDSCVGGSEIWWCMHSAHSLSTTLSFIQ